MEKTVTVDFTLKTKRREQMAGHAGWCVQTQNRMGGPVRSYWTSRKQTHTHTVLAHMYKHLQLCPSPVTRCRCQVYNTCVYLRIQPRERTRIQPQIHTNRASTHTHLPMRRSIFLRASDSSAEVESPITADLAVSMSRL